MSDSLLPPILNPSSLYKQEAKRDATRIRIYNSVLNSIYTRVKAVSRIPDNEKVLLYVVPEFIPGTPRFDIGDAILYIVWNLRNAGYTVTYTHPNLLHISWKAHDERYRAIESPWSQVLQSARTQVLSGASEPSIISSLLRPAPTTVTPVEIQKRKTPIKKTVEFKPVVERIHAAGGPTNPSIISAMYSSSNTTASSTARLPGQLSEKHVSFV